MLGARVFERKCTLLRVDSLVYILLACPYIAYIAYMAESQKGGSESD